MHTAPPFLFLTLLAPTHHGQRSTPTAIAAGPPDVGGSAPRVRDRLARNSAVLPADTSAAPSPPANCDCTDNPRHGRVVSSLGNARRAGASAPAACDRNAHLRALGRWPASRRSTSARRRCTSPLATALTGIPVGRR